MVCSSGVGFDPLIDGTRHTFYASGLYNGLFVMTDDQTGSVWTHFDGTVLQGPLAGDGVALELEPIVHVPWSDWLADHPDTLVPTWFTGFEERYRDITPGGGGLSAYFESTLVHEDDRLGVGELVLGVNVGADYRAYVLASVAYDGPVAIADELGGSPVVVFADAAANYGLAFCASIDGTTLEFDVADGAWVSGDGTRWNAAGTAVAGPRAGEQLAFVTSFVTEWYGWSGYYPSTSIYGT